MDGKPHILVVDDNREIRDLVDKFLTQYDFRVTAVADGKAMRRALETSQIDLVVLDIMLPGEDGLSLCRWLRGEKPGLPIIMVTAIGGEADRIVGLEMGADDYLPKPFSARELLARIKAVMRRSAGVAAGISADEEKSAVYHFIGWKLDAPSRKLTSPDGMLVPLSSGEFDMLLVFVQHPHRVLNRDQLLDLARGRSSVSFDRSIDTQVSRLRRKIETDQKDPAIIKTVWGEGYVFSAPVSRE
ncbi:MAG TPA: response regulator [Candidatus Sulfotelmatobacter sp.]|jgi:two-component system OmpR family response regulator|nr:response regulator [Candidatus Sulfotelmatobacter sp.]